MMRFPFAPRKCCCRLVQSRREQTHTNHGVVWCRYRGRAHSVCGAVQDRQRHLDVQRLQLRARGTQGAYASTHVCSHNVRLVVLLWCGSELQMEWYSRFRVMFGVGMPCWLETWQLRARVSRHCWAFGNKSVIDVPHKSWYHVWVLMCAQVLLLPGRVLDVDGHLSTPGDSDLTIINLTEKILPPSVRLVN